MHSLSALLLSLLSALPLSPSQSQRPTAMPPPQASSQPGSTSDTVKRKTSKPYTGSVDVFEYKDREKKLQIERVMDLLGLAPGRNVADIGAGSGWFTVRAAKRVSPGGLAYAVDISQDAIRYIQDRLRKEGLQNVRPILSHEDDPLLPEKSVDAVLMLKTYHEIAQPVRLLRNLRKSLRPGASVGVIDRNGKGDDHGVARDVVIREAGEAGYSLAGQYDFVKPDNMDYFLIFQVTGDSSASKPN